MRRRLPLLLSLVLAFALGALSSSTRLVLAKDGNDAPALRAVFAPHGTIESTLASVLDGARKSVRIAVYNFTSRPLSDAVIRAKARGVDVRVILDDNEVSPEWSRFQDLERAKVPLRLMILGKNSLGQPIRFHHKFMVVDGETVTTGSYNWTTQADSDNFENEVILRSHRLAKEFREVFDACWAKAEDPGPDAGRKKRSKDEGEGN